MTSVAVIGNDPSAISLNKTFHDVYVFNQIYHMEKHSFPCPTRIFHMWNHLFKDRVEKRHSYLKRKCPQSILKLATLSKMHLSAIPIQNLSLSSGTVRCFQTFNRNRDGHPWTLGFFLLSTLVQRNVHPHVYGFSHRAWNGHPVKCEKRAVAEWNQKHHLVYHPPTLHQKRVAYVPRMPSLRKTSS